MSPTVEPGHARGWIRRRLARFAFHCLVWSLVLVVLVPLIWPLMMSLNEVSVEALVDRGLLWWLRGVDVGAFVYTVVYSPFLRVLANSVLVSTASAAVSAAVATTGAYGIARFDFGGRRLVVVSLLALLMVPQAVVAIPLFLLFDTLGLLNTRLGLVVAYVAFTLPFTTLLLWPLFASVPGWLEDAAMVDGCTRAGAFARVFLPAAEPAIAAAFTFGWILAYNESLFAVILIDDPAKRTLPVGFGYGVGAPGLASVLSSLPMLAIFGLLWRYFLADDVRRFVD